MLASVSRSACRPEPPVGSDRPKVRTIGGVSLGIGLFVCSIYWLLKRPDKESAQTARLCGLKSRGHVRWPFFRAKVDRIIVREPVKRRSDTFRTGVARRVTLTWRCRRGGQRNSNEAPTKPQRNPNAARKPSESR